MSPRDPRQTSSAAWRPPVQQDADSSGPAKYVTTDHFTTFINEFRGFANQITDRLASIDERMGDGSTRFATQAQSVELMKKRGDEHSAVLKVLADDKIARDAVTKQAGEMEQPKKARWEKVQETVITAAVLGALAVGYSVVHDYMTREDKAKEPASVYTTPKPNQHSPDRTPPTSAAP